MFPEGNGRKREKTTSVPAAKTASLQLHLREVGIADCLAIHPGGGEVKVESGP